MSLRTNPVEGLSALERSDMRYVPHVRSCDDPHKAFARNRVTKSPVDGRPETVPAKQCEQDKQQQVSGDKLAIGKREADSPKAAYEPEQHENPET